MDTITGRLKSYKLNSDNDLTIDIIDNQPFWFTTIESRLILKRNNPNFEKICDLFTEYYSANELYFIVKLVNCNETRTFIDCLVVNYYEVIDVNLEKKSEYSTFEGVVSGVSIGFGKRISFEDTDLELWDWDLDYSYRLGQKYNLKYNLSSFAIVEVL